MVFPEREIQYILTLIDHDIDDIIGINGGK